MQPSENRILSKDSPAGSISVNGMEFRHLRTAHELDVATGDLELPVLSDMIDCDAGRYFYSVIENGKTIGIAELADSGSSFSLVDTIGPKGKTVVPVSEAGEALTARLQMIRTMSPRF